MVKAIPDGYHSVTPYLVVDGAGRLIEFMTRAFGGQERMRMPMPDGRVGHAEVVIGDSPIMLADSSPEHPPMPAFIHLYVDDVDGLYRRALAAGATSEMAPENQFYGDRSATVRDAFGNRWSLAAHVEDVSEDEMMRRMAALSPA